ncbi:hypothetical protein [Solitalea lacus]|uniref:hypothetical protein n=1 Tax=Solitalea lacus TaxID=2911172 RepID=UPI001EDB305E|nr:hypothetical protein [Solitalea lacus]UKJ07551.1 hypothetical protein L2B55_18790 [Solitalea lacus]
MNNTFSLQRFKLLVLKEWAENRRLYLFAIPLIAIVISMFFYYMGDNIQSAIKLSYNTRHDSYTYPIWRHKHEGVYNIVLILLSACWANMRFNHLSGKAKSIGFLMQPATCFEKFILNWLLVFPALLLVYTLVFCIIDYFFINAYISMAKAGGAESLLKELAYVDLKYAWFDTVALLALYSIFTSIFLLGPFLFKRYAFVSTLLVVAAGTYGYVQWHENRVYVYGLQQFLKLEYLMSWPHQIVVIVWVLMIPALVWVATYLRIKEREV